MEFKRVQVEKGIRQIGPDRWEVQVHVGRDPVSGKQRGVSRTTRKGIADARRLRARLTTEVAQGKHGGTSGTVGSLFDEWLATGVRLGRAPRTIAGYHQKVDSVIRPALGAMRVEKVTSHTLDAFYGRLLDGGTSPATVMHHHRIISAAFHQAERWGWIDRNPARLASPPSVPRKELHVPSPEQVRELIARAGASRNPEVATIVAFAALSGVRRGELVGLRWGDVDWADSSLTVRRSVWETTKAWGVKDPKNHQVRRLVLGEHTLGVLAGRWDRVSAAADLAKITISPEAYVFSPELDGSRPARLGTVTQAFSRLCRQAEGAAAERLGIPVAELPASEQWRYRFHDLRHYTATELFSAGHHARTVADRLGHADPALTLRVYTHNTEDQARAAATSIEGGLVPPRTKRAPRPPVPRADSSRAVSN